MSSFPQNNKNWENKEERYERGKIEKNGKKGKMKGKMEVKVLPLWSFEVGELLFSNKASNVTNTLDRY